MGGGGGDLEQQLYASRPHKHYSNYLFSEVSRQEHCIPDVILPKKLFSERGSKIKGGVGFRNNSNRGHHLLADMWSNTLKSI